MEQTGRASNRGARRDSSDRRAIESRQRLVEALTTIMQQEGPDAASASRVAQVAGLSRSGFYEQFASVDDLALFILDSLLTDVVTQDRQARSLPNPPVRELTVIALERIFTKVLSERHLFEHILLSGRAAGTVNHALETFQNAARPGVQAGQPGWQPERIELTAAAIGGALLGAVMSALREDHPRSPRELALELMDVFPDWYPVVH